MIKNVVMVSSISCLLLIGCTTTYTKPGATQQDWQHEYNDCLVKANQAGYSGGSVGDNINRKKFLDMCVQGQGWTKQTKESMQAQSEQKSDLEQKRADYKAKMAEFNDRLKAICAKAEYSPLAAKTPCSGTEITFEQMADSEKIKANQKKVFLKFRTEVADLNKEMREYIRASAIAESDRQWADYLESTQTIIEAYSLDLYRGKTTWGEYNKSRKDLVGQIQAEWRNIFQSKRH